MDIAARSVEAYPSAAPMIKDMTPFVGYVIAICLVFMVARALLRIPQRDVPPGSSMGE